jgi:hypothetical protein
MIDPWTRIERAFAKRSGVRLTFEELSTMIASRDPFGMEVGGKPAEKAVASLLLGAMQRTDSDVTLVGIGCLLAADSLVELADSRDVKLLTDCRKAMLRAGVYPNTDVGVRDVLVWLKLLKQQGVQPPVEPMAEEIIDAVVRIVKKNPRLFGSKSASIIEKPATHFPE